MVRDFFCLHLSQNSEGFSRRLNAQFVHQGLAAGFECFHRLWAVAQGKEKHHQTGVEEFTGAVDGEGFLVKLDRRGVIALLDFQFAEFLQETQISALELLTLSCGPILVRIFLEILPFV